MSEKNNKTINGQKIFCLACMGLMAVASVVLVIMLFTSGLLNKGIVWAITGGLALLNGLHIWLQLGKGKVHVGKTGGTQNAVCRLPRGHLRGRICPHR